MDEALRGGVGEDEWPGAGERAGSRAVSQGMYLYAGQLRPRCFCAFGSPFYQSMPELAGGDSVPRAIVYERKVRSNAESFELRRVRLARAMSLIQSGTVCNERCVP